MKKLDPEVVAELEQYGFRVARDVSEADEFFLVVTKLPKGKKEELFQKMSNARKKLLIDSKVRLVTLSFKTST